MAKTKKTRAEKAGKGQRICSLDSCDTVMPAAQRVCPTCNHEQRPKSTRSGKKKTRKHSAESIKPKDLEYVLRLYESIKAPTGTEIVKPTAKRPGLTDYQRAESQEKMQELIDLNKSWDEWEAHKATLNPRMIAKIKRAMEAIAGEEE